MTYSVPEAVADGVIAAAMEGRAIQGAWRKKPPGGRGPELVCALAAFGSNINSSADCPAEYMPEWLAHLIPTLDDGIAEDDVVPFFIGLGERAKRWHVLDEAAWERVRIAFLSAAVTQALEAAESVCPEPRPGYFDQVHDACGLVLAALKGDGDLGAATAAAGAATWAAAKAAARAAARAATAAATAAARAARAATAAAEAATAAAEAATWAAAEAATWAARAAARAAAKAAARAAAEAAEAAEAGADTYKRLVDALFAALDAEIGDQP